ncbi:hypothetical protein POM88_018531 [Heracleum sosnowskyi]|uniref:Uncharacterized protein n=1 Tax=Heracleum sosnowskyi TaxID=360622 RepID=A0AAD8ISI2_9APIA|nr:hypothetical protein POM88_018531 [Heracleum sosnowskyi]
MKIALLILMVSLVLTSATTDRVEARDTGNHYQRTPVTINAKLGRKVNGGVNNDQGTTKTINKDVSNVGTGNFKEINDAPRDSNPGSHPRERERLERRIIRRGSPLGRSSPRGSPPRTSPSSRRRSRDRMSKRGGRGGGRSPLSDRSRPNDNGRRDNDVHRRRSERRD